MSFQTILLFIFWVLFISIHGYRYKLQEKNIWHVVSMRIFAIRFAFLKLVPSSTQELLGLYYVLSFKCYCSIFTLRYCFYFLQHKIPKINYLLFYTHRWPNLDFLAWEGMGDFKGNK